MTDYDATAHIAEEIKNPAVKAPVAIISALGTTYVLGWILNIVLCLCMGAWPDLLLSPTGLPAAQIFYNVLGKKGGITFMVLSTVICNFTGATAIQAQARTLFALARGVVLISLEANLKMRCCRFQSICIRYPQERKLLLFRCGSMSFSALASV